MKSNDAKVKNAISSESETKRTPLIENRDFTLAAWPTQYPVPLFTWSELSQLLNENNGKLPEDMWRERLKLNQQREKMGK